MKRTENIRGLISMGILRFLQDKRFDIFFSVILGIGIICMIRPVCEGNDCTLRKAPQEKDFDKFVYRMGKKCYQFKTKIVSCPASGAVEAFEQPLHQAHQAQAQQQAQAQAQASDAFSRRPTPIV
jgi:hypothetical protein